MKDLRYVSQQISKGHNLDTNLDKYSASMASMYNTLAYIKLSMNYYTMYDILSEKEYDEELFQKIWHELNEIIDDQIINQNAKGIVRIDMIRNEIIDIMEVVTSYTDRFRIYEYVLNRMEYQFKDIAVDEKYYGMYFTNDIIHYILSDKDRVVVNSKISEIVEQLPMRLSKAKFYDYLKEAFTLYHGAEKRTINDFVYTLKTSAMIQNVEGFDTMFPEMYEMYNTLSNANYDKLGEEEYNRLHNVLTLATDKISECADMFVMLAQLVNDVYTIILTDEKTSDNIDEVAVARQIIELINKADKDNYKILSDEIAGRFTLFEGKQERIIENISENEYIIEYAFNNLKDKLDDNNLMNVFDAFDKAQKLQSGSDFVELETDESLLEIPDDSYADDASLKLIEEFDAFFKEQPVVIRRAVMAQVLSQLPVFFENVDEIQQYINVALQQCSNKAEKAAVLEIIGSIMNVKCG